MQRKVDLASGETYHIYNRGAHKESIFRGHSDYERFLLLMFLSNNTESIQLSRLASDCKRQSRSYVDIFGTEAVDQSLVQVLAYCLMPNHFHIVLRQVSENGITRYMQRLSTGYSMYFNIQYAHSGVLFQGPFKSQHIDDEAYFRYIFSYVHTNPIDLVAPGWETKGIENISDVSAFISEYLYSSYRHYQQGATRCPENVILSNVDVPEFLYEQQDVPDLLSRVRDAAN